MLLFSLFFVHHYTYTYIQTCPEPAIYCSIESEDTQYDSQCTRFCGLTPQHAYIADVHIRLDICSRAVCLNGLGDRSLGLFQSSVHVV